MTYSTGGQTNFTHVRTVSASAQVQEQIVELIRSGKLVISERLPAERELVGLLGVSRATLREALTSLSDQGILSAKHGAGWYIEPKSEPLVRNMVLHFKLADVTFAHVATARMLMEPEIARLAAVNHGPEQLADISRALDEMIEAAALPAFLHADSAFHEAIAVASCNPFFALAIKPALLFLEATRASAVQSSQQDIIAALSKIHDAIRARDGARAAAAMVAHLQHFVSLEQASSSTQRSSSWVV